MSETENGAALAAPDAGTVESATPNESVSWETTAESVGDKLFPEREPSGQFKGDDKPAPAEGETPAEPKPKASPAAASPEPATPAIAAPQSLPAELKADLEKAPPALQSWIAKREAESHQRISELGQQVKSFEPIRQQLEPLRQVSQRNGVSEGEGLQRLLAANDYLEKDAPAAIKWLAEAYGVDLGATSTTPGEGQGSETTALKAEIASLRRQVGETHNTVMARVNAEKATAQASLAKLVNDFASAPERADFKDVEQDVVAHIAAIRAAEPDLEPTKLLEKAYDAARWANPVTRAKMLESQRKVEETKREEETKAKAAQAKRAGNLNVKSGSGASPAKKGTWEDTVSAVADRVYGN